MERKTFVLKQTKGFRRYVRIYLKTNENKTDQRMICFTTEHKISEKERNRNARKIAAEYSTSDEKMYDGILRDTGYGITFVLVGDPEGKLKRTPFDITPVDAKKIALKNLFDAIGLKFDNDKSYEVLQEEYRIQVNATAGTDIKGSGPAVIDIKPKDVGQELVDQADAARNAYKEKYGEEIPDEYANDKAFLSALGNPDFDAKAYMAKPEPEASDDKAEATIEDVREQYFNAFGANVANAKKNDKAWMLKKIAEK